jgi:hypothetical protein
LPSYVERRVFPGGCFFAATSLEMGARPGPVKDPAVLNLARQVVRLRLGEEQALPGVGQVVAESPG